MLGSVLWESKFDGLLVLVKEYIVEMWKIQKQNNYMTVTQDLVCNSILNLQQLFTWGEEW